MVNRMDEIVTAANSYAKYRRLVANNCRRSDEMVLATLKATDDRLASDVGDTSVLKAFDVDVEVVHHSHRPTVLGRKASSHTHSDILCLLLRKSFKDEPYRLGHRKVSQVPAWASRHLRQK